jgi:formate dehydrogenase (NADP+) beta subunit
MKRIAFSSWKNEIIDNRGKSPENFSEPETISLPPLFSDEEREIKAWMGWDGIVIRSDQVDIVDMCRAYMALVHTASCGRCFPCRMGTRLMDDILTRICKGEGAMDDIDTLRRTGRIITTSAKCNIGQSGVIPILHALEHYPESFRRAIEEKKPIPPGRYLSKVTAPCMEACPIHLNIPDYIEAIRNGDYQKSLEIIQTRLPLPGVVGRVCVRPCEENCRRKNIDAPVSIKFLKRFVADQAIQHGNPISYSVKPSKKTGKVAIVGAGPGGVTCAYHLAKKGHQVTIYERLGEPGGMSAMGIPDYRLPRNILQDEVALIESMGVTIKYNHTVGKDVTLQELEQNFDAVFIAIGAQKGTFMGAEGEKMNYKGYIHGVDYLLDINSGKDPYPEGKTVCVIGGGNVAIDCVRSSFRIGKTGVNLIYRRTKKEMPADPVEIHDAEEEKVTFHYLTTPVKILAKDGKVVGLEMIRMELGEPDASGRRRPVPMEGSEFVIDCDIVVPAIGQAVDLSLLEGIDDVKTTRWNTIVVDPVTKQSDRPTIFSAGDCETGPGALITACAGGRRAAISIDKLINGRPLTYTNEDYFEPLLEAVKIYDPDEKIDSLGGQPRQELTMLPPDTRKFTFDEVEAGFSPQEAVAESLRCLRCYRVAMVAV